ncbi:MAG: S41 family peptidase [Ignavibacteria bacterium]
MKNKQRNTSEGNRHLTKHIMINSKIILTTFVLLTLIITSISYSQTDCGCEQALNQLIQKVETEYPGFKDKTKDRILYNSFKENLITKAGSISESNCIELLRSYKDFFRDGHISIYPSGQELNVQQNKVTISQEEFQKRILKTTDPIEGIWRSGAYKVGIVKQNEEYQGFIIEADTNFWKANEIKFRLLENGKAKYYLRDHSLSEEMWELVDGWVLYFKNSKFIKEFPIPNLSESEIKSRMEEIDGCYFKKVSEKTVLLCLSSFEHNYVERIKKLLADNKKTIESSENLIIDVRNNLGGTYDAYVDLLPYIHTNNVRGLGMEFLVTQTLIDEIEGWYDDEEGKSRAKEWVTIFKGKMGEFVNTDSTDYYVDTIKLAERSPKQVVILVNRRTASSGEAFVLDAKQSKKVKILGTPTYGALDYGSASFFDFGCKNYKLMMPTWRSMRLPDYPIDNIGIQPDIYLDKSVKDWVRFAADYMENKK